MKVEFLVSILAAAVIFVQCQDEQETRPEEGQDGEPQQQQAPPPQRQQRGMADNIRPLDDLPKKEREMYGSRSLRCLVCKAVIEEFDEAIKLVDPKKKIEAGTFRLKANGERESKIV